MDNNQQSASQPSGKPTVENVTLAHTEVRPTVTNLNINEPKTMSGNSVQSPLSGSDVSMTTGQPYGGPIASTEVEPNVRREAGPY
jgi:hypothetical protein